MIKLSDKTYSKLNILDDVLRALGGDGLCIFNEDYKGQFCDPPQVSLYFITEVNQITNAILPLVPELIGIIENHGVDNFIITADRCLSVPFPDRMTIKTDHGKLCKAEFESVIKHFNNL